MRPIQTRIADEIHSLRSTNDAEGLSEALKQVSAAVSVLGARLDSKDTDD